MKKKLFSVTANDCTWQYYRGSGDGGQKKQKTSSAARCIHEPSGAVGEAQDSRKQSENRKLAFKRMIETKTFQCWLQLEIDQKLGRVETELYDPVTNTWYPGEPKNEGY
jgi:protein subunit release factor A